MRILLLGKNGQVGWELQRALAPLGELVACDFDSPGELRADFTQPETLRALVWRVQPVVIVNAAAHTAVDKAEAEPDLAHQLNATAPAVLADEAEACGALLVHYSTDYVFDGSGVEAREEDDATGPLNVYGRSKLEGERLIRMSGCQHLILRTSWVYAARGGNFARTMLRLAAEREEMKVVNDQIGAPTGADLLADVTAHAVMRLRATPELAGTYHCVAGGEASWFDYARHVIEWARAAGVALKLPPDGLLPVASSEFRTAAARPLNSRLSTRKLREAFGLVPPLWTAGVERMLVEAYGR
ncbi:MAG: dTDP-4-dehydrorhamnose reductase [Rubrivivax sp.]|nr:dTDP-4-dehydrorhamnose reductase [Rubrivivax sp.]MCL4700191.1 dTDP-4-dehydrorhamnose reductase [Burkholderiaceae bacterium]